MQGIKALFLSTALSGTLLLSACVTDQANSSMDKSSTNMSDAKPGTSVLRLSRSAAAAGDEVSAISVLKQGILSNPKASELYIELAERYIKSGNTAEAIKVLEVGEKSNPENYQIIRKLGNAYLMVEQPEKALVVFEKGMEITKDDPLLHSSRGIALDLLSRTEEARKEYDEALKIQNENINAMNNLAMSHVLSSDLPKAREILEKIAFRKTAPVQVRQNLAFVYALMGEGEKAKQVGLRDFSENEVRDNLEFYKKLSGFMVSESTAAEVAPVAASEVKQVHLAEKTTHAEAKSQPRLAENLEPKELPKVEKKIEAKEEPKPEKKPEPKVEAKQEAKPEPKIEADADITPNEELKSAHEEKQEKSTFSKLLDFKVEPAKEEAKQGGTVMNAPQEQAAEKAEAPAEQPQKKEMVDEKTIFPWLVKRDEPAAKPAQEMAKADTVVPLPEAAKGPALAKEKAPEKVAEKKDVKPQTAAVAKAQDDKKPAKQPAKEMAMAEALANLAPGSGGQAHLPASSAKEEPKSAEAKADEVDREHVFSPGTAKKYFLQLGEYSSEADAKNGWSAASKKVDALRNYKFMFLDSPKGMKKVVIGPFTYGEQYSAIAHELDAKKLTYTVIQQ